MSMVVDGARVDLAELRDLLLQAFVRLVGVAAAPSPEPK